MERHEYRDDDLLTKAELAEVLKVSVRTIDRYVAESSGPPFIRVGRGRGQIRFRWSSVKRWVDDREER